MGSVRIGFSRPKAQSPWRRRLSKLAGITCEQAWFFYYDYNWDLAVVLAPHADGFRLVPHDRFERENDVITIIRPPVVIDAGLRWALVHVAQSFVFKGWLDREAQYLKRAAKSRFYYPFHTSTGILSARLIADALREANYPHVASLPRGDLTPDELLYFMTRHNDL